MGTGRSDQPEAWRGQCVAVASASWLSRPDDLITTVYLFRPKSRSYDDSSNVLPNMNPDDRLVSAIVKHLTDIKTCNLPATCTALGLPAGEEYPLLLQFVCASPP